MLIERLIVRKTYPHNKVIRDIPFNLRGLSLIVDVTTDVAEDSGNNVGKTTAIKIIDLCLGAKSVRSLYYDDDTKSENSDIRNFLKDYKVEAELLLTNNKVGKEKKTVSIIRQLYNHGKRIVDDNEYTQDEFSDKLKLVLFASTARYPTFRQLIPKFIRVNDTTSDNMIKYLPGSQSRETYDTIYLFLFRVLKSNLLSERDILSNNLKECEKKLKLYEQDDNIASLDSLRQRKELVENDLIGLATKRKNLSYMEAYKEELQKKRELTSKINILESQVQLIELDIRCINENIQRLMKEKSDINLSQINHIYNEAKAYIGELNKTFNDVVKFHNNMIQNRINFITSNLDSKNNELDSILKKRDELLEEKKKVTIDILDEGLLDELNILNTKIEKLNVEKGEIQQATKIVEGVNEEILDTLSKVAIIDKQMDPEIINKKIKAFNTYFSAYCEKLYGEKYLFVYHNNWKEQDKFPVSLDFYKGKVGTGMKKGLIVAFDLAYIKYAEVMELSTPQFVIHDRLESTHINQLKTVFELCQEINGQYIIPILRERVDKVDSKLIEEAKVLELSTEDKFFRV